MNVRPLHDRIIVRRLEESEQQVGGIIIPDSAKEKPQRGTVLSAGNGKMNDDGKRVAYCPISQPSRRIDPHTRHHAARA